MRLLPRLLNNISSTCAITGINTPEELFDPAFGWFRIYRLLTSRHITLNYHYQAFRYSLQFVPSTEFRRRHRQRCRRTRYLTLIPVSTSLPKRLPLVGVRMSAHSHFHAGQRADGS